MAKDSYYFPHDYNARNDRKIAALVKKHGAAGYGVFWITCEMMHEEDGNIEFDEITFGAIGKDANEEIEFVKKVITDCIKEFKLFNMEDDIVISGRVSRNLEKRQEISKSRAIAGQKGRIAQQNSAKERKEIKEKKENKQQEGGVGETILESNLFRKPNKPTKEQVWRVFNDSGGTKEMAKSFWDKYESTGWYLNGSPVTNYTSLAQRFIANWKENRKKEEPESSAPPLKNINHGV